MILQTISKKQGKIRYIEKCLIHYTSCDSQDLSLTFSLFVCFSSYSILPVGSVPSRCVPPAQGEASMMETSESRPCFHTGAITENGISITLLSVKLSR